MSLKNSENQYGAVTKSFHWIMALLVICLLAIGLYMGGMPNSAAKLQMYNLHKSLGITVLALVICRICWHSISKKPGFVETMKPWERKLATAGHTLLYLLMLMLPLTGWLMSSAAGRTVSFFGLFILPDLVSPDKILTKTFRGLHENIGTLIMITVGLHILAALKHHFMDKDSVLKRMLPALLIILFASTAHAADTTWNVDRNKSSIAFKGRQMGTEFNGRFDRFRADINFDPDNLAASTVKVAVDIATANTRSAERDEIIKGKDWFDVAQFPVARFETTSFLKTGDKTYEALANLTIRDVTLPVILPFRLEIRMNDSDKELTATVDASVILDRSKFNLGGGSWADTGVIANEVPVSIHVVASKGKTAG